MRRHRRTFDSGHRPHRRLLRGELLTATPISTAAVRACINSVNASRIGAPGASVPVASATAAVAT